MTKTPIVITSINYPTEAVKTFAKLDKFELIVVGDLKTPKDWKFNNVKFINVNDQKKRPYNLAKLLPYNHYCRKMIGYLEAFSSMPKKIIDTDDDNIPKINWEFPEMEGDFETIKNNLGFINIYQLYSQKKIWPRGLPLDLISKNFTLNTTEIKSKIGVWQGLADEDPDVDAIYRLTDNTPIYFKDRAPIVLDNGTISPFNSQNTIFDKTCFSLMYLPTFVTFRFTDILRSYVAQPIMWNAGYKLGFTNATVIQKRNPHDFMKDFESELPMYINCKKTMDIVQSSISNHKSINDNLYEAYRALLKNKIVISEELNTLTAWLRDVENI